VQNPGWVEFDPVDASAVIDMVRSVANAADPGEHGDGVEVVIETPRPRRLSGWRRGPVDPAQARIVVTTAGGTVEYPFDVRLVSEHDGAAARMVGARPGWAVSNSAGLAFLVQKGRAGQRFDWGGLVGGAVIALKALRPGAGRRGWRARVERAIARRD